MEANICTLRDAVIAEFEYAYALQQLMVLRGQQRIDIRMQAPLNPADFFGRVESLTRKVLQTDAVISSEETVTGGTSEVAEICGQFYESYHVAAHEWSKAVLESIFETSERIGLDESRNEAAEYEIMSEHAEDICSQIACEQMEMPDRNKLEAQIRKESAIAANESDCQGAKTKRTVPATIVENQLQQVIGSEAGQIMKIAAREDLTADDKMRRILRIDRSFAGKTSADWAMLLNIQAASVRQTECWKLI